MIRLRSLEAFLAWIIALTASVLAITAGVVAFFAQQARSEAESAALVISLMTTVENTASVAAFANSPEIATDMIQGLLTNVIVRRAELQSKLGMRVARERPGTAAGLPPLQRPIYSPFNTQDQVGILIIEPDAAWVAAQARRSAIEWVVAMVGIIALSALVSGLAVRNLLSRPLVGLARTLRRITPGGTERLQVAPHLEANEVGELVGGFNDMLANVAEAIQVERRLRAQVESVERRMHILFKTVRAGILEIDAEGRMTAGNPALAQLINMPPEELASWEGKPILARIFAEPEPIWARIRDMRPPDLDFATDALLYRGPASHSTWVHAQVSVRFDDANPAAGFVSAQCVMQDVTSRRLEEEVARFAAEHDHLTKLRNRRAAEAELRRLLSLAATRGFRIAVLLIDLDGFKQINDTHGHEAGDFVLVQTAERMVGNIRRRGDVAARLGGDEFLAILNDCKGTEDVSPIASTLINALRAPIVLTGGRLVTVGASIGIAFAPDDADDADTLIAAADRAMYSIKRSGKNGFAFAAELPPPPADDSEQPPDTAK